MTQSRHGRPPGSGPRAFHSPMNPAGQHGPERSRLSRTASPSPLPPRPHGVNGNHTRTRAHPRTWGAGGPSPRAPRFPQGPEGVAEGLDESHAPDRQTWASLRRRAPLHLFSAWGSLRPPCSTPAQVSAGGGSRRARGSRRGRRTPGAGQRESRTCQATRPAARAPMGKEPHQEGQELDEGDVHGHPHDEGPDPRPHRHPAPPTAFPEPARMRRKAGAG